MKKGLFDYLMKPIDIGVIVERINQAAAKKKTQDRHLAPHEHKEKELLGVQPMRPGHGSSRRRATGPLSGGHRATA
jgi:DNA-binding NtrC family response regulator